MTSTVTFTRSSINAKAFSRDATVRSRTPSVTRVNQQPANQARKRHSRALRGLNCVSELHKGPVVVHLFENSSKSPAFPTFQEGLYHILEVAKDHPSYATTLIHEVIDESEDKTEDWSYAAVSLYTEGGAPVDSTALWEENDMYHTAMEFGVDTPNHEAVMSEVAALPDGTDSPLAPGMKAETSDKDVVLLAIYSETWTGPLAVQLAERIQSELPSVASVCLYKGEGDFTCCLRVELAGPLDIELETLEKGFANIAESAPGLIHSGVYRVLFACPKDGPPVGLIAAQKATDLANEAGMSAMEDES